MHGKGDFFGEGWLTGQSLHLASVVALTQSEIMRFTKAAIVRVLRGEPKFSEKFMAHLLARNARVEADLADQLFNSSETMSGASASPNGEFWQKGNSRTSHSDSQPGDARGNDRYHKGAREHFYEKIP